MNYLTNIENQKKLNQRELELGKTGTKSSWHNVYKDSAWINVGGLPFDLTEGDVICVFSQYGEIVNINMPRDKKTGKPRGFAFICFEDQRSTILTVDNLNGMKLLGRTIRADHVKDYKPPDVDDKNIDDTTRQIRVEGVAPKPLRSDESSDEDLLPINKEEKKKKKKNKKEKKHKKKKDEEVESCGKPAIKREPTWSDDTPTDRSKTQDNDIQSRLRGDNITSSKTSRNAVNGSSQRYRDELLRSENRQRCGRKRSHSPRHSTRSRSRDRSRLSPSLSRSDHHARPRSHERRSSRSRDKESRRHSSRDRTHREPRR